MSHETEEGQVRTAARAVAGLEEGDGARVRIDAAMLFPFALLSLVYYMAERRNYPEPLPAAWTAMPRRAGHNIP